MVKYENGPNEAWNQKKNLKENKRYNSSRHILFWWLKQSGNEFVPLIRGHPNLASNIHCIIWTNQRLLEYQMKLNKTSLVYTNVLNTYTLIHITLYIYCMLFTKCNIDN